MAQETDGYVNNSKVNIAPKLSEVSYSDKRMCSRSLGPTASDCPALLAKNGRHRDVADAFLPSRLSVLSCASRLRYMVIKLKL